MSKLFTQRMLLLAWVCAFVLAATAYPNQPINRSQSGSPVVAMDGLCEGQLVGELFVRTELFFGSSKPDGSVVTEEEFQQFLDQQITPRFPDGLTLLVGTGQFRDSSGVIIQERSMVLILLYLLGISGSNENIEQIRKAYKSAFQQQSVFRADSRMRVSF